MAELSASKKRYVKAIYELDREGVGARISDIAEELGVSKPSVCRTIEFLQREKLVGKTFYRRVFLTPKRKAMAESILDKFGVIKRFLTEVFGIDEKKAVVDASALEPVMSGEVCRSMSEFLETPKSS